MKWVREHIERVRERPRHARKAYAMTVAGITTGLIAIVWLTAVTQTGYYGLIGNTRSVVAQSTSAPSPSEQFGRFKNEFLEQLNDSPAHQEAKNLIGDYQRQQAAASLIAVNASSSETHGIDSSEGATVEDSEVMATSGPSYDAAPGEVPQL